MAQEIDFQPNASDIKSWDWAKYDSHVSDKLGTFGDEILDNATTLYPHTIDPEYTLTTMASDIRANCPNDVLARMAAEGFTSVVYRYVGAAAPSVPIHAFGAIEFESKYAMHGWDTSAFFGFIPELIANPTPDDISFQNTMQQMIVNFAKTGKVLDPEWRTFPLSTAVISSNITIVDNYHARECVFWLRHGFYSYGWIN